MIAIVAFYTPDAKHEIWIHLACTTGLQNYFQLFVLWPFASKIFQISSYNIEISWRHTKVVFLVYYIEKHERWLSDLGLVNFYHPSPPHRIHCLGSMINIIGLLWEKGRKECYVCSPCWATYKERRDKNLITSFSSNHCWLLAHNLLVPQQRLN